MYHTQSSRRRVWHRPSTAALPSVSPTRSAPLLVPLLPLPLHLQQIYRPSTPTGSLSPCHSLGRCPLRTLPLPPRHSTQGIPSGCQGRTSGCAQRHKVSPLRQSRTPPCRSSPALRHHSQKVEGGGVAMATGSILLLRRRRIGCLGLWELCWCPCGGGGAGGQASGNSTADIAFVHLQHEWMSRKKQYTLRCTNSFLYFFVLPRLLLLRLVRDLSCTVHVTAGS